MKKSVLVIIAVSAVIVVVAAVLVLQSDDGDDDGPVEGGITATVWLDDGSVQTELSGTGSDVRSILRSALSDHDLVLRTNGGISSVDGVLNSPDSAWTVFRWTSYYDPDNTGGVWVEYSSQDAFDGMILAVKHSDRTVAEDGSVSYEKPDIDVKVKVYFYIMMPEAGDSTEWLRLIPLSEEDKEVGMWIAGYGSTSNEALGDAILSTFFPEYTASVFVDTDAQTVTYEVIDADGVQRDGFWYYEIRGGSYGWFLTFLGRTDTNTHGNTWQYWAQYTYSPDAKTYDDKEYWEYNQSAFGMYDITKYHYFGLCLWTTDEDQDLVPSGIGMPSGIDGSLTDMPYIKGN